jgi:hypothetical protein
MCPSVAKKATLQWYRYVIYGVGFHCLEMNNSLLEAPSSSVANAATVIINDPDLHVKMTPSLLDQDLKRLVNESRDWKVKQLNHSDFVVIFRDEASLKLCKNVGGMTLPVSKIRVIFADPKVDPGSVAMLSKIWILLSEDLACLRRTALLMEGMKMLGRPRMVDEDSLSQDGPVACFSTPITLTSSLLMCCCLLKKYALEENNIGLICIFHIVNNRFNTMLELCQSETLV